MCLPMTKDQFDRIEAEIVRVFSKIFDEEHAKTFHIHPAIAKMIYFYDKPMGGACPIFVLGKGSGKGPWKVNFNFDECKADKVESAWYLDENFWDSKEANKVGFPFN